MYLSSTLNEYLENADKCDFVPVWIELSSDIFTPVEVYLCLADGVEASYLLESVEVGEIGARFSFIGIAPVETISVSGEDPLPLIRSFVNSLRFAHDDMSFPFSNGFVGYISYDLVRFFEPVKVKRQTLYPEAMFILPSIQVCFDHRERRMRVVCWLDVRYKTLDEKKKLYYKGVSIIEGVLNRINTSKGLLPINYSIIKGNSSNVNFKMDMVQSNISRDEFIDMVKRAKTYIYNGDIIQVVLSQRFELDTIVDPFMVYRVLRLLNPSPYMFYFNFPRQRLQLVGASPEMLVKVNKGVVETHPIAGTRRRGKNFEEDKKLADELLSDEKEKAEHIMLVDLGRNDLGRVSELGSIQVKDFMHIEYYSHVMHIVSRVLGRLAKDKDSLDVLKATFPAGTVTGAPKIRAMELINELEPDPRGIYAGSVGYVDFLGNLDMCIAIRTIVFYNKRSYVQAGAGIVADSVPELEYMETQNKARAQILAIKIAEGFDDKK